MSESQKADLVKWGQESLPVQHLGKPEELAYYDLNKKLDSLEEENGQIKARKYLLLR